MDDFAARKKKIYRAICISVDEKDVESCDAAIKFVINIFISGILTILEYKIACMQVFLITGDGKNVFIKCRAALTSLLYIILKKSCCFFFPSISPALCPTSRSETRRIDHFIS